MKASLVILASVAALIEGICAWWQSVPAQASSSASREASLLRLPPSTKAGQSTMYGHINALTRKGGHFEVRFDPAWMLTGVPAERAKLEDTGSSDVPNDSYVVEEGHRLLTYVVPGSARVTVLTRGLRPIGITVSELGQVVKGKNPKHRPLFDTQNGLGFWIRIGPKYPSPVLSLDQQYHP